MNGRIWRTNKRRNADLFQSSAALIDLQCDMIFSERGLVEQEGVYGAPPRLFYLPFDWSMFVIVST
jgi:hypothetical protein